MSVSLLFSPDLHSFTQGGRLYYAFAGDSPVITPGIHAVNTLGVTGTVADGDTVTIRWNGRTEVLTARDTPVEANDFPSGVASADYMLELVAFFQAHYAFREDFTIETIGLPIGVIWSVDFYAKKPGPAYNFLNLPGLPLNPANAIPGVAPVRRERNAVYVEIWTAKSGVIVGSDGLDEADADRIYTGYLETDDEGSVRFDAGSVLHAQLTPDWPGTVRADNSARAYYIQYAQAYGTPTQVGQLSKSETAYAYLGGAAHVRQAGTGLRANTWVGIQRSQDVALRFGPLTRYVRPDEPQYLTFLNQRDDVAQIGLRVVVIFADGTSTQTDALVPKQVYRRGDKLTFAVGFSQLQLAGVDETKTVQEYQIQLANGATGNANEEHSKTYRYILNYDYQPYTKYFVYLNSLGSWDTLTTFGKGSSEWARFAEQAERVLPIGYDAREGQFVEYDIALQLQGEVTTGYRQEGELRRWADFYRSPSKFLMLRGRMEPIGLLSKSIQQSKDGDTLFAHKFEYVRLYQDEFYTDEPEGDPAPPSGFTPAGTVAVTVNTGPQVNSVDVTVPDPVRDITAIQISNWVAAYSWGDHRAAGYMNVAQAANLFPSKNSVYSKTEADNRYAQVSAITLDRVTEGSASTTNTARLGAVELSNMTQATEVGEVVVATELPDGRHSLDRIPASELPAQVLIGSGPPEADLGNFKNVYIDEDNLILYGPKTAEGWGTGFRLDRNRVHVGFGAPDPALGMVGDTYIDRAGQTIHQKTVTGWDAGTALGSGSGGGSGIEGDPEDYWQFLLDELSLYLTDPDTDGFDAEPLAERVRPMVPFKHRQEVPNQPDQKPCYRLALLPASDGSASSSVQITGVLGGWEAFNQETIRVGIAIRDGFAYRFELLEPNPSQVGILAIRLPTGETWIGVEYALPFGKADLHVSVENGTPDTAFTNMERPTGELLFDSRQYRTYRPDLLVVGGEVQVAGVRLLDQPVEWSDPRTDILGVFEGKLVALSAIEFRRRASGWIEGIFSYDPATEFIPARYYRICQHPASTAGTFDSVAITLIGGGWVAQQRSTIHYEAGTRNGYVPRWRSEGPLSPAESPTAIVTYEEANGLHTTYLHCPTNFAAFRFNANGQQVLIDHQLTPVLTPTGTLVFDSRQPTLYPLNWHEGTTEISTPKTLNMDSAKIKKLPPMPSNARFVAWDEETQNLGSFSIDQVAAAVAAKLGLAPPANTGTAPFWPSIPAQTLTVGTAYEYTVPAPGDNEGGTIPVSVVSTLPAWLSFNTSTLKFSATNPSVVSDFSATLRATDPENNSKDVAIAFRVNPAAVVSFAPTIVDWNPATGLLTVGVQGQDPTGAIDWQINGNREWGGSTFTIPSHQRTGTTFTVEVRQNGKIASIQWTSSSKAGPNNPPVPNGTIPAQTGFAGEPFSYTLPSNLFFDPNGDAIAFSMFGLPDGWSLAGSTFGGTTSEVFTNRTITVRGTDTAGGSSQTTFLLSVYTKSKIVQTTPLWDANTGNLTLQWSNALVGEPVQVLIPAISTDWNRPNNNPTFFIPANLRSGQLAVEVRQRNGDGSYTVSSGIWTWTARTAITDIASLLAYQGEFRLLHIGAMANRVTAAGAEIRYEYNVATGSPTQTTSWSKMNTRAASGIGSSTDYWQQVQNMSYDRIVATIRPADNPDDLDARLSITIERPLPQTGSDAFARPSNDPLRVVQSGGVFALNQDDASPDDQTIWTGTEA
ncbi:hypothetical protein F5984_20505 [Rudanella paleaurantiibacter]|uniref:T9SS type A sorting domain-containing protein n=1 Tax=Rudanella paleaurantiibacter TaxID=2614655 RepID=A0A7J5TVF1_9BACT|nr:putative Ig domain-containing protein [Rudanella paleaurantiibacter]KAB7728130.1 hypothetical protein F5984_20505 [Rudanella paleaurantiibacter]